MTTPPGRGEVWMVDLGDPVGHEQGYRRLAVAISADRLHRIGRIVAMLLDLP